MATKKLTLSADEDTIQLAKSVAHWNSMSVYY